MTEFAKHGSLYTVLQSDKALSMSTKCRLALETARGLLYLHQLNYIHRDIKSPNVMVTADWHAKLGEYVFVLFLYSFATCSFGLAKARTETRTTTKQSGATSIRWTAPELFGLEPEYTTACDVYSFGVLLWEIITRKVFCGVGFVVC